MRTYSHTLLTHTAAHRLTPSNSAAIWAAAGATIPDLPAITGATWLFAKNRVFSREAFDSDVCARTVFRAPDAALHSIPSLLLAFTLLAATRTGGVPLAFVLGWAGHVTADALTHSTDARPLFWPLSKRRFQSPISYRERDRHALAVTVVEHALILAALVRYRHSSQQTRPIQPAFQQASHKTKTLDNAYYVLPSIWMLYGCFMDERSI